jgi:shikimate dehydrogenase
MKSYAALSGETRVVPIIGDPIAQVKSPADVTEALLERGRNCVVVPIHVALSDVHDFIRGMSLAKNVDGMIVTVPHKFAAYQHCSTTTERAHFLGAVNILRRNPDGGWHGDQVDGLAFVRGIRSAGCAPEGQRSLLVGAGGAGSAIALALLDAGVAELAIHDRDTARRDALVLRLQNRYAATIRAGSADPSGYTLVVNATPAGMRPADPFPVDVEKLTPGMFVGDVITAPAVTPLVEAARSLGYKIQVGAGMFAAVSELMVDFLLEDDASVPSAATGTSGTRTSGSRP